MRQVFITILLFYAMLSCQTKSEAPPSPTAETHDIVKSGVDIQETYALRCGGCHGANMEGNSASPLIKTDWLYGHWKGAIFNNIKYGIKGTDMAAFGSILNDDEIESIAAHIIKAQSGGNTKIETEIPTVIETSSHTMMIQKLDSAGLTVPWAIEFVGEQTALISERGGKLKWIRNGKIDPAEITNLPTPHTGSSTGGFMDIALDPDYDKNGWIYLSYSHSDDDPKDKKALALTKIVRGKVQDNNWTNEQTLFEAPPTLRVVDGNRWGCRFLFDKDGYLYFTIGDMAQDADSQDLTKATGKVFRINSDGSIPDDNPYVDTDDALPQIYTIGNRNTQGLTQHPITGDIWSTDHGPMGGDELNLLRKGANYGWPLITYGVDYSGSIVSELTHKDGLEQPATYWTPSIGICAAEFASDQKFSNWKNKLLVAGLALQELWLITLDGETVTNKELVLKNIGRIRDVKFSPLGDLYVILNRPDIILKITPRESI